jgi:hypothetical protein
MENLTINDVNYKVKISIKQNGSNYNKWAHIFRQQEKMPIVGTSFNDKVPKSQIIEWAKGAIDRFTNQNCLTL